MPKSIYWTADGGVFVNKKLRNCWEIHRDDDAKSADYVATSTLGLEPIYGTNQQELQKKALKSTRKWLKTQERRLNALRARLELLDWKWTEKHEMTYDRTRNCYEAILDGKTKYKQTIITDDYGTEPKTIYTCQGEI